MFIRKPTEELLMKRWFKIFVCMFVFLVVFGVGLCIFPEKFAIPFGVLMLLAYILGFLDCHVNLD